VHTHILEIILTYSMNSNKDSVFYDNFSELGSRIFRIKLDVGETECNKLIEKAIDELLKKNGEDEKFREETISNIEWLFKLYREYAE